MYISKQGPYSVEKAFISAEMIGELSNLMNIRKV